MDNNTYVGGSSERNAAMFDKFEKLKTCEGINIHMTFKRKCIGGLIILRGTFYLAPLSYFVFTIRQFQLNCHL